MSDFSVPLKNPTKVIGVEENLGDTEALEELAEKVKPPEVVKKPYTEDELDAFWDATLSNEPYLEQGKLSFKTKVLKYVLSTRTVEDINNVSETLEGMNIVMKDRWETIRSQLLLATAIHMFDGTLFPKGTDSLLKRHEIVLKMSAPVVAGLLRKLYEFDTKVMAMQEAVFSENF